MDHRRQSGLWAHNASHEPDDPALTGPYRYYEPPSRRTYSERADVANPPPPRPSANAAAAAPPRSNSRKIRDIAEGVSQKLQRQDPASAEDRYARPTRLGPDPNATAPVDLRQEPWSPDVASRHHATNASEALRRGSVPDRSPLQKLEMNFNSKQEKRAKLEEAELRAREKSVGVGAGGGGGRYYAQSQHQQQQPSSLTEKEREVLRQGTQRNGQTRAVSEGNRRASEDVYGRRRDDDAITRRQASAGAPPVQAPPSGASKFRRATEALREQTSPQNEAYDEQQPQQRRVHQDAKPDFRAPISSEQREPARKDTDLNRTASGKYRHRARDAGFMGAAAAMAGGATASGDGNAADRGRAAHERRKGSLLPGQQDSPQSSPISPTHSEPRSGFARSGSKKLQKRAPSKSNSRASGDVGHAQDRDSRFQQPTGAPEPHVARQALQTARMGASEKQERDAANRHQEADPLPPRHVATGHDDPLNYHVPPQTAASQQARDKVNFRTAAQTSPVSAPEQDKHHHRHLGGLFHRHEHDHRSYQPNEPPMEEWRRAGIAKLSLADLELDQAGHAPTATADDGTKNAAWWEKNGRRSSSAGSTSMPQHDGPFEEDAKLFRPQLLLKCGPLLRYTGMRKEAASGRNDADREVWRGSVMIVTLDDKSDYSSAPTLRLFAQPMDLHKPPPQHLLDSGQELPPEFEDPVAGQVKVSRTGRPLYVRPVHDIDGDIDLSREENPQGLYAATRTPMLGPQHTSGPDGRQSQHITFQDKSRIKKRDGEKLGRHREVRGARLHAERGCTFWRFNLEIELASTQRRVAYRVNQGPAIGFWVPGRGETMNIMFHSCNGFSLSVDSHTFSGPDPLWRDVLNRHQSRPFHVMLGGGDQIYNDAAMRDTELFASWLAEKNPERKHRADFTPDMQEELETFYLDRYSMWFSQGLFGMANSQIPMVNVWDDHDIIDGFGSYPHHFMSTRVFTGLGAVAFKYYMLFQHQSTPAETTRDEPSWLLGASPGPYIHELSRSVYMRLGAKVALLGLDCRTERMRDEIMSESSYDMVFERLRAEMRQSAPTTNTGSEEGGPRGDIRHLIVLLGVPIAYPRLNFLENILTSNAMIPLKALGRTGLLGGFVNKFDGGVEILDDLDDHWTAKHHKAERNWFIRELQHFAAEHSVRVTILGGDVHLGAVGQFYTNKKMGLAKDRDWRYMPNVISSAIVNKPPPNALADVLNRRNRVHHLDDETDEDLIPLFDRDVDGTKRANRCLLPRRNYAVIGEWVPGHTPPATPTGEGVGGREAFEDGGRERERQRMFPPGSMNTGRKRTMSLTRGPAALVRRLSGSTAKQRGGAFDQQQQQQQQQGLEDARPYSSGSQTTGGMGRRASLGGANGSYFPPAPGSETSTAVAVRPSFHRRPTNISIKEARKAAAKGGGEGILADGREPGHIDLQHGLDISLNVEIDQHDPSGATVGYRLLVPALWCREGESATQRPGISRGRSLVDRLTGRQRQRELEDDERSFTGSESGSEQSRESHDTDRGHWPHKVGLGGMAYTGDGNANTASRDSRRYASGPPIGANAPGTSTGATRLQGTGYNVSSPPLQQQRQLQQQQVKQDHLVPQPIATRRTSAPTSTGPYGQPQQQQSQPLRPSAQHYQQEEEAPEPAKPSWRLWRKRTQSPHREEYYSDEEGSMTPSDEEFDDRPPPSHAYTHTANANTTQGANASGQPPQRRLSKAERFFGIGEEGGPWGGSGGGAAGAGPPNAQMPREDSYGARSDGMKQKPGWKIWR